MNSMKASELRNMSAEQLTAKLKELKAELFNLRFQHAINQLENPMANVENPGRVSQSTAYCILARVALNFAGYPLYEPGMYAKAKGYAQKVIETGYHSLHPSYEELFKCYIQDRYYPQESLWEVEFYGNNEGTYSATAGRVGRDNGIACSSTALRTEIMPNGMTVVDTYGSAYGMIRSNPYYFGLFDAADLRRNWTIAPYI